MKVIDYSISIQLIIGIMYIITVRMREGGTTVGTWQVCTLLMCVVDVPTHPAKPDCPVVPVLLARSPISLSSHHPECH